MLGGSDLRCRRDGEDVVFFIETVVVSEGSVWGNHNRTSSQHTTDLCRVPLQSILEGIAEKQKDAKWWSIFLEEDRITVLCATLCCTRDMVRKVLAEVRVTK